MKAAFITGITGQDGSYLAEHLLDEGTLVIGLKRRSARGDLGSLDHPSFKRKSDILFIEGDILDALSIKEIMRSILDQAHVSDLEIYHLAAQSHVGLSHRIPSATIENNLIGTINVMDAAREIEKGTSKKIRTYFAGTSESFSGMPGTCPQNESTPFAPRSPYAISKVAGIHYARYMRSLGHFVSTGLLFNHECIDSCTPVMLKENGFIKIVYAGDIIAKTNYRDSLCKTFDLTDLRLKIWDGEEWTQLQTLTATRRQDNNPDHKLSVVQVRTGVVMATQHHNMIMSDNNIKPLRDLQIKESVKTGSLLMKGEKKTNLTHELAELLGCLVADGYIAEDGGIRFSKVDKNLRNRVVELAQICFGNIGYRHIVGESGFGKDICSEHIDISGAREIGTWLRKLLYAKDKKKQVPDIILNASPDIMKSFLKGYYQCDGLKTQNWRCFSSNSALLAQGLCYLYSITENANCRIYMEQRDGRQYYQIRPREEDEQKKKIDNEIRRIDDSVNPSEYVIDLETGSGKFMAGVGIVVIHNSPRRSLDFVTRKVTWHIASIKLGLCKKVSLGTLNTSRDWGHAKDFTRGMISILRHPLSDDFVLATGRMRSIGDLVDVACQAAGLPGDYHQYVEIDPQFTRPVEVHQLCGDASKAKKLLNWSPMISFEQMITEMYESDYNILKAQMGGKILP